MILVTSHIIFCYSDVNTSLVYKTQFPEKNKIIRLVIVIFSSGDGKLQLNEFMTLLMNELQTNDTEKDIIAAFKVGLYL